LGYAFKVLGEAAPHTCRRHVGAPDNRIEGSSIKEYVLTPRGKDMNPVLGPVVAASPERRLSYL
jgi:hypothetical protein